MSFFWQMAFSQMQSSGRWLLKRIGGGGGASHGLTWPLMRSWPRRLCGKARSGGWKRRTFSTAHWHPRPVKALADVCVLGAGCLSTCGGPLFEFFGAERSKFRTPAGRSICGWFQGFTLVPEKVPQNVCEALLRGSAFWAFRGWKVRAARSWRDYHDTLVH